ncbi:hypothetical protein F2Q70_00036317 [Brassica cretica]|uniref:Nucleotide-diphospho-sugar transferase domain-containing protein n=1 Tax=Brassica cretica TaxID=69181 RepID=A0A8S9JSJ0_BRACR|nr:hypothetical protein F2Q70_00036317 [Brassica cretica]
MYNDVDMVWLQDPFQYLDGSHDAYFMDDLTEIKPLNHSHDLPPPNRKGATYICSCMIFLRPTNGAKLLMNKWIEELGSLFWAKPKEGNDQPAFNWALNKTAHELLMNKWIEELGSLFWAKPKEGNDQPAFNWALNKTAHEGFYNLTSRRPQHLLDILELGYNVMYNDVDMVWLQDPFKYLQGSQDVYFMDDMTAIKPLNHSHGLPPSRNGVTYVCSCMIFLRCTSGAKLLLKKWVEEIRAQPWSNTEAKKPHDQPAFNRALHKITQV